MVKPRTNTWFPDVLKVMSVLVGYAFHITTYFITTVENTLSINFRGDYRFYGLSLLAAHQSPYTSGSGFRYLPLGAVMLHLSDVFLGFAGWIVVSEIALLAGAYFLISKPGDLRHLVVRVKESWLVLCLLFAGIPLLDSSVFKTVDVLVFMFIVMMWHFSSKGKMLKDQVLAGAFLGFAIGLKVVPAILLGLLIYRRQIMSILSAVAVNALGLALYCIYLPSDLLTPLRQWLDVNSLIDIQQWYRLDNSNPLKFLYDALFNNGWIDNRWLMLSFAVLCFAIAISDFTRKRAPDDHWLFYLSLMTTPLLMGCLFEHHMVMLFPIYAMPLVGYGLKRRIAIASLFLLVLLPYTDFNISFQVGNTTLQIPTIGGLVEITPIAMSVLYSWLLLRNLDFDSKMPRRLVVVVASILRRKRVKQALALGILIVVGYYAIFLHIPGSERFNSCYAAVQKSPYVDLSYPVQPWEVELCERYKPANLHITELGSELASHWKGSAHIVDVEAWLAKIEIHNNFVNALGVWIYLPCCDWTKTILYQYWNIIAWTAFLLSLVVASRINSYLRDERAYRRCDSDTLLTKGLTRREIRSVSP